MTAPPTMTAYRIGAAALRHWRAVIGLPAVAGAAAVVASFAVAPRFTSSASFIPQQPSRQALPSAATSLASQLGITIPGMASGQSPLLYLQLVDSRRILGTLLETSFANPDRDRFPGRDSLLLLDLLQIGTTMSPARRFEAGLRALRDAVSVDVDEKTNLVGISFESRYPRLAQQVTARIVALLDAFNRETRQSQARERRRFAESRIAEAQQAIRDGEAALEDFYSRNRTYRDTPRLIFREAQLQRQLSVEQDLYLTLQREAEVSRLDEVNDTPLLTMVDLPVVPAYRSKPNRKLLLVFGLLAGAAIAAARVLLDASLRTPLPPHLSELEELRLEAARVQNTVRSAMRVRREKREG